MTYDDLPYGYKQYAADKGWENAQALAYWQQAAEYRQYLVTSITHLMGVWTVNTRKRAGKYLSAYNTVLHAVRGSRAQLS